MPERPPDIRLEDLENPVFPPKVVAIFKDITPMAESIEFNPDALMTEASERTNGLDDFGSEEYLEPLEVVCNAIAKESNFGPMGFLSAKEQIVGSLVARLRLENFLKQNPEILETDFLAPIIIAGLPRSGTTHLHNLTASDTNLRSLPWWEAQEPFPSEEEWGMTEPRIQRCKESVEQSNLLMPHFNRMHDMTWDHVHEEIGLLLIAGSSMQYDTMGVLPIWREYYKATDQTPYFKYLKRILMALSALREPGKRWILKSPQHLEQFKPIMNVFPDATMLVTHRDPVSVVASMSTMLAYSARLTYDAPIDIPRIGKWWKELLTDMLEACLHEREVLPADQSMDILFHEFMADDVAMLERAYKLANQPWDDEVAKNVTEYMDTHPRGRHGKIIYDLRDFGLDPYELQAELSPYIERFQVQTDYPEFLKG